MKLSVVGTGSKGNCYIVHNDDEALIIECGVRFELIKKALNYDLKKVCGMIVSHSHNDHCKSVKDAIVAGFDIHAHPKTIEAMGFSSHRLHGITPGKPFNVGKFQVIGFELKHYEFKFNGIKNEMLPIPCLGFLINHTETGKFCFITDSYYCEYRFKGLNNIIVEANYCQTILQDRLDNGEEPSFLRDRILKSHMSLQTCKEFLSANDLKQVVNIVLIHLSDRNSHAKRFEKEIKDLTAKRVTVAENGTEIPFGLTTF